MSGKGGYPTEYVPLEERVALFDIPVDGRRYASLFIIGTPSDDDISQGPRHQASKALVVASGNDTCIRVGRERVVDAELCGCLLDRFHKGILSRAWNENVVGRHANL